MTHDDQLAGRLVEWMDVTASSAERTEVVQAAMAATVGVRQRHAWLVRDGLGAMRGHGARRALALMVSLGLVLALAAVGLGALFGSRPANTDPTPPLRWPSLSVRATGSLVVPRQCHSAVLLDDGRVLIVGGRNTEGDVVTTPEIYDPGSGTFRALAGATLAGDGASVTRLADGRVLIAGGRGSFRFAPDLQDPCLTYDDSAQGAWELGDAFLFDPETELIEPTGSLRTARSGHVAMLLDDGRVLIAGGNGTDERGVHHSLRSAEVFDAETGAFETTGPMSRSRGWTRALSGADAPSAVRTPDGRIVVTGGAGLLDRVDDVYDPETGGFTAAYTGDDEPTEGPWLLDVACRGFPCLHRFDPDAGPGPLIRDMPFESSVLHPAFNTGSAWLLSGDRLLFATGASVALYDIVSGDAWQTASAVVEEYRRNASATALADGRALITGGTDANWDVTGAAEIAGPSE